MSIVFCQYFFSETICCNDGDFYCSNTKFEVSLAIFRHCYLAYFHQDEKISLRKFKFFILGFYIDESHGRLSRAVLNETEQKICNPEPQYHATTKHTTLICRIPRRPQRGQSCIPTRVVLRRSLPDLGMTSFFNVFHTPSRPIKTKTTRCKFESSLISRTFFLGNHQSM